MGEILFLKTITVLYAVGGGHKRKSWQFHCVPSNTYCTSSFTYILDTETFYYLTVKHICSICVNPALEMCSPLSSGAVTQPLG
jgi:hypothetical protein